MDLRDYLNILRHRWLLIASVTLGVVALAALATWRTTPQYASSTDLFISTSQASDDNQAFQGSQFSLQRVKSYAEMVNQNEITRRVIQRLDLDETPAELSEQITATSQLDTVILTITVTDPSPERAQRIAETTADVFVGYVGELETPPGQDQATIKATVTNQATEPKSPVSPQPLRNLGLGLVLGLLLGAGLAVLRETLDTSVKTHRQLEELAEAPVIGAIPFDGGADGAPLISEIDTYSPRAEAFRVLRTNLQFIDPDANKKVFVLSSALPGEGKSTTACNLALALAEGGQKVALVEGDLRRPRVAQYLGLVDAVGLTTVLVGRIELSDAMQETQFPGLAVLSSGKTPPNPAELLQSRAMSSLIGQLREEYDVVLIDAPPLLPVTDAALIASVVDGAVLVVRHGKTSADQVRGAVERLEGVGAKPVAAVFNMTPTKTGRYGYGYGYGYGYAPQEGSALEEFSRPQPMQARKASRGGEEPPAEGQPAPRRRDRPSEDLDALEDAVGREEELRARRLDASRGLRLDLDEPTEGRGKPRR
ncbi:polysaccharide biosynthesis tyrosine autokinase [Aeromicrobium sp. 50.2.37]|uniref:polysaccharide biosynthesis tyrosine autokinase n=1 Tax=Aeromicrobium sp. 50.2.37 TaxID=2969305 RepID=UPI002150115B|nr:polysaccharide biosynthesis tyrosine autokinase [Aeromicrobium sp. 50.2.37]MCR4513029.1 polysaccharide biosynthesis tyrosine autokinase [Aeromicrobium sp. 50.2.37]